MVVVGFILQFWNPLCTRAVENELQLVPVRFGELPGGFESVDESAEVTVRFRIGENDNCCFRDRLPRLKSWASPPMTRDSVV